MTVTLRALVLVLIGIAAGTVIRPVEAQTESSPFQVGQRLVLWYGGDKGTVYCTLLEVRDSFVRCEGSKPDPFMRGPVEVNWFNIASTVSISIREK